MGEHAVDILGLPVSTLSMTESLRAVESWIERKDCHFVCFRDVHGVMVCQHDHRLMEIHHAAGLVAPDGVPLVWAGRFLFGKPHMERVCGPDFLPAFCARSEQTGFRHFFYGGPPGVAEKLAANLQQRYPKMQVAGCYSPPFRTLTADEDAEIIRMIDESGADLVWVGLSSPKQEHWMADHVGRLKAPALLGVGAAFDFHAGTVKRAPKFMQRSGTEWLYRLVSEPKRLWKRYLLLAPQFVFFLLRQVLTVKKKP